MKNILVPLPRSLGAFCQRLNLTSLTKMFSLIAALTLSFWSTVSLAAGLPVFPGAEGFGSDTVAGRGGAIYRITTLAANGPGSLHECVRASGPRVCVFEVSGTIELTEVLGISNPFITIAGQTAPSPGITIKGAGLTIPGHDVLVQHIRIRVGDDPLGPSPGNRDGIAIENGAYNVIVDHVSVSWAVDGNIDLWSAGTRDVTISNSIISEALRYSIHPKGSHSTGVLIGRYVQNVTMIGNLLAHNEARNPLIQEDVGAVIVNNVIYNPSRSGIDVSTHDVGFTNVSAVGNVVIQGPSSQSASTAIKVYNDNMTVYVDDNRCADYVPADPLSCVSLYASPDVIEIDPPIWNDPLTVLPGDVVVAAVLANVGARPINRDSVDVRIIDDVDNRTGAIIDSQDDVGGWPQLAENYRELTWPPDPNGDDDNDGYTNLEEWLHQIAAQVEGQAPTQDPTFPPDPETDPAPDPDTDPDPATDPEPGSDPADTVAPVVSLEAELNLRGIVTSVVTAIDNRELSHAEIYINDRLAGIVFGDSPYKHSWEPRNKNRRSHKVEVIVFDRAGNYGIDRVKLRVSK